MFVILNNIDTTVKEGSRFATKLGLLDSLLHFFRFLI